MKHLQVFTVIFLLITLPLDAQGLRIFNEAKGKEILLEENKRIRLKTVGGQKLSGTWKISDNNQITIAGDTIALSDIASIKRHPMAGSILTSGAFIYAGAIMAGFGVIIGITGNPAGFLLIIPASAMVHTGIRSPNFFRKFKGQHGWKFSIVEAEEKLAKSSEKTPGHRRMGTEAY